MKTMRYFAFCLFSFLMSSVFADYQFTLAATAIFQNEAQYLQEWIEFHQLVGVEHFYLYNNESWDNYQEVLAPYIEEGIVELFEWPNLWPKIRFALGAQRNAYDDVVQRARGNAKWLAVLDIDEFVFPIQQQRLDQLLESEYSDYAGVLVNEQTYGTGGIAVVDPSKPMIEQFIRKSKTDFSMNYFYKSIVQPELTGLAKGAHSFEYSEGYYGVDTNTNFVDKPIRTPKVNLDKIRINHYWTRDEKTFYEIKIPRFMIARKGQEGGLAGALRLGRFLNETTDKTIFKYLPKLKKRLAYRNGK